MISQIQKYWERPATELSYSY